MLQLNLYPILRATAQIIIVQHNFCGFYFLSFKLSTWNLLIAKNVHLWESQLRATTLRMANHFTVKTLSKATCNSTTFHNWRIIKSNLLYSKAQEDPRTKPLDDPDLVSHSPIPWVVKWATDSKLVIMHTKELSTQSCFTVSCIEL